MFVSSMVMASEKIFIGSVELAEPTNFKIVKNKSGQAVVFAEAVIDWGRETNRESGSVMKVIPALNIKGREISYKGVIVGKIDGAFQPGYMKKELMDIVIEKEYYCSIFYKKDDCVETTLRYNVFLFLKYPNVITDQFQSK
tara:strand:+ start:612 stop:1034 length:423 start_codon:yes stop_codon:yes gene_type:complete